MSEMKTLLPGATLGLLGGGQLGRMFSQAAARMGYHVAVLEPGKNSPAGEVSLKQITRSYDDAEGLQTLAQCAQAVTTEFENVPAKSLAALAALGLPTAPHADAVAATQDRNVEKSFIERAGVPTAPHQAVKRIEDIESLSDDLFPGILKTARLGYDGKGQARVHSKAEAKTAWESFGRVDCVLERCSRSKRRSRSSSAAMPLVTQRFFRSAKTIIAQAFWPTPSCPRAFRLSLPLERRNTQKK